MNKVIAVDFDGTLCESKYPDIGKPNRAVIKKLRRAVVNGDKIILWTCRCGKYLDEAVEFCKKQNIKLSAVNDNLPELIDSFGNNPRKIFADIYLDDRAVIP